MGIRSSATAELIFNDVKVPKENLLGKEGEGFKIDKCDTCLSIGREDDQPHCVLTCPVQALHFGPLSEMEALAAEKGGARMEGETAPSVYVS